MSIESFDVTFVLVSSKMDCTIFFERDGFILDLCALVSFEFVYVHIFKLNQEKHAYLEYTYRLVAYKQKYESSISYFVSPLASHPIFPKVMSSKHKTLLLS